MIILVKINFRIHDLELYIRRIERRMIDERRQAEEEEEEERPQPRVNYAQIPPVVSDGPNILLHPNVLTQEEINTIFTNNKQEENQTLAPILYNFGEKPFVALNVSRKAEGHRRMRRWIKQKNAINKPLAMEVASTKILKTAKKKSLRCKNRKVACRVTKAAVSASRLRNKVQSSSGLSEHDETREGNTKKMQTRAQKLGSSCVKSNKPSVTPICTSPQLKSNKTVRGSAKCTKKAIRTTRTTKSLLPSTRVLRSHK